jgi:hypothetical protein
MKKEHLDRIAACASGNMDEYAQLIAKSDPSLSRRVLALTKEIDKKHKLHTIRAEFE